MPATNTVDGVELNHGDICTMEGLFQKHYVHQIKRGESKEQAQRLNATFRWIVQHTASCPLHVPGDDASVSDMYAADEDEEDDDEDEEDDGAAAGEDSEGGDAHSSGSGGQVGAAAYQ